MDLERLLAKAHDVVTWTTQDTIRPDAAGAKHLYAARFEYYKARVEYYAPLRALTTIDTGGCTCKNCHNPDANRCIYHYAAQLQPDNHKIPWNCPTYYDGCNCEDPPRTV